VPSAREVQEKILAVMRELDPRSQTHAEMAARLEGFAGAHQVAMNMCTMSADGRLEWACEGWDGWPESKRYRLP
jgi:hypothetical protein